MCQRKRYVSFFFLGHLPAYSPIILSSFTCLKWILDFVLSVLRSFLLSFSFETHLLYLLLKSLLPAMYAERRAALIGP